MVGCVVVVLVVTYRSFFFFCFFVSSIQILIVLTLPVLNNFEPVFFAIFISRLDVE
jgi:hypothetical protein